MQDIIKPFEDNDYYEFFRCAYMMRGACGYVAAGNLYYICYFITDYYRFT